MFDIIIPVYNNLEETKKCVQSVRQFTETGMYHIYLVDDASTDETRDWALSQQTKYKDITVLIHFKNQGYVESTTTGVNASAKSKNPYIFILNNDVTILSWWTHEALKLFKDKTVAIVGAFGHKEVCGKMINFISGSRLIIRKDIIKKLGFYNLNFKFGYWEDVELSYRVQKRGYKICKFQLPSYHVGGGTFKKNLEKKRYYVHNKRYLESIIEREG